MNKCKKYLLLICGSVLYSVGVSLFYIPNKIVTGGLMGISNILYHIYNIQPGLSFFIINLLLVIAGIKILGKTAVIDAFVSFTVSSLTMQVLVNLPAASNNLVISTVFGAVLYGIGLGICFAIGANTGGTDIIARIVQLKRPDFPVGKILMCIDGIIILIALFLFKNVDLCLFGILALCIATYVVDLVIKKLNVSKYAYVITEHGDLMSENLVSTSPRGVTMYDAVGAYSKSKKQVLMCALKANEIQKFQNTVLSIDNEAFIIFLEAQQIVGNGFRVYK